MNLADPFTDAETFVRFMRLVHVPEGRGLCWTWTGNKPDGRYGHFSLGMKTVKAHRWLYQLINGPIPEGLVIRHKCDNPQCVNPMHLERGTHAENQRDKHARGRAPNRKGEKHPLARLTDEKVIEIRKLAGCGMTQPAIAEKFGVNRQQIGRIVRRENWSHV